MTEKIYALDLNNEEWVKWLAEELKEPKFRADQICQWLWQKRVFDVEEMTNLSKPLRDALAERVDFGEPVLIQEERSGIDGTRKYLWQMHDRQSVESVLMRQGERFTACISTQVGCPLQCTFCATGLSGYVRNLTAGEIAGQFLAMEKSLGCEINNVVYMGMGEPFLNTVAVLKSVRMLNSPKMRNLGIRHMTISTSGVIPGIRALADSGLGVRLAVSLHAVDDELRSMLMPVNETFPVDELRKAMQEYQKITGDRITIEYALFDGVNDSVEHARDLLRYLKGIHVFINLIPFNAVDNRYERSKPENVLRFRRILETAGFETEIRQEQGADIDAACGQLRRKTMAGDLCALEPKTYSAKRKDLRSSEQKPMVVRKPVRTVKRRDSVPIHPEDAPKREFAQKSVTKSPSGGFVGERGRYKPDPKAGADMHKNEQETRQERKPARPYKRKDADATHSEAAPKRAYTSKYAAKSASGRFVEENGNRRPDSTDKRRKTDRPEPDHYRSGKKKEDRPLYKAQGEGSEAGHKEYKPREAKPPTGRGASRGERRSPDSRSSESYGIKNEFGENRKSEGFNQKRAPKTIKTGRKTSQKLAGKHKKQK